MSIRYSKKYAKIVADRHAGGKAISEIGLQTGMPNKGTILEWMGEHPEFAAMMEAAQATYLSVLADECVQIANQAKLDDDDKAVQRAKLQIDTRMKIIEKLAPEKYGRNRKGGDSPGAAAAKGPKLSDNELVRRIMFGIDRARRGQAKAANAMKMVAVEAQDG